MPGTTGLMITYWDSNKSTSEATFYMWQPDKDILIISLYVDDLQVIENKKKMVDIFKVEMHNVFEMKDLEEMSYFLDGGIPMSR